MPITLITALLPSVLPFIFSKGKSKMPKGMTESAYIGVYAVGSSIYEKMMDCGGLTIECASPDVVDAELWGALASAVVIAGIRAFDKYKEAVNN